MKMMERLNRMLNNPLVALAAALVLLSVGVALGNTYGRVAEQQRVRTLLLDMAREDTAEYRVMYRCMVDGIRAKGQEAAQ